jgi:hypothetical protein
MTPDHQNTSPLILISTLKSQRLGINFDIKRILKKFRKNNYIIFFILINKDR